MKRMEGKNEWRLSLVNTWTVSRGHNELIGEFKMAAVRVISIGLGYEVHIYWNKNLKDLVRLVENC